MYKNNAIINKIDKYIIIALEFKKTIIFRFLDMYREELSESVLW